MASSMLLIACFGIVIAGALVAPSNADCPDVSVRCRIARSNWGSETNENGCEVGGEAQASFPEGSATVSINGKCYFKETSTDNAEYAVVGTITIGQCWGNWQWWCTPEHCGWTPSGMCNDKLADCTVSRNGGCDNWYTVVSGDSCWAIANNNGMSLGSFQAINPGFDCSNLQPNDRLCIHVGQGPPTTVCEGYTI